VPRERADRALALIDRSEALLVAGSTLVVQSGLRLVRRAVADGLPIVIVNRGATRGDRFATVKIDAGVSETLLALADALVGEG
jgi:NAD-dependent SIR2 family protein deacetylase